MWMASSSRASKILVADAQRRLERADHVADHIFAGVVQQGGQPPFRLEVGPDVGGDLLDHHAVLGHREAVLAGGLAVPARHRAKPWAMSSISMSIGEGSSRSSLRPDSMRCHARGGVLCSPLATRSFLTVKVQALPSLDWPIV